MLFLVLETVAIVTFIGSNPYHNARIVNASNAVLGGIHSQLSAVDNYFGLRGENRRLMEEVASLRSQLSRQQVHDSVPAPGIDSSFHISTLEYTVARVVRNTITKRNNYITINAGTANGVGPEMALINSDGILGYILHSSEHYSVGVSVLNVADFNTSGKIKDSEFTGSISWDGASYRYVELTQMPKYANLAVGDTIVTTEYSDRFPADLPIGTVESFELENATFFKLRVKLFADMSRLKYVYVVKLNDQNERRELENKIKQ